VFVATSGAASGWTEVGTGTGALELGCSSIRLDFEELLGIFAGDGADGAVAAGAGICCSETEGAGGAAESRRSNLGATRIEAKTRANPIAKGTAYWFRFEGRAA
jgi:hypothetical protein